MSDISFDDATAFRAAANYLIESCDMFNQDELKAFVEFVDKLEPETLRKAFEGSKKFAQFLIEVREYED